MTPVEPAVQLPGTAPSPATAEDEGVLSPELVMIDPELRERLSSLPLPVRWLPPEPEPPPPPEPEPAPPPEPVEAEAPAPPPLRVAEPPPPPPPEPEPLPAPRRRRRRWPLLVALLLLAVAGAAAAYELVPSDATPSRATAPPGPTTGHIGQPASSTPATTSAATPPPAATTTPPAHTTPTAPRTSTQRANATPPVATHTAPTHTTPAHTTPAHTVKPKPSTTPKPPPAATTKTPPSPVTHQKLAWAPVAGAGAYDVQLLRGTALVYVARTTHPSVVIAVAKGPHPPRGSVRTGTYEWVVLPIIGGHRSTHPIVRSKLRLSG